MLAIVSCRETIASRIGEAYTIREEEVQGMAVSEKQRAWTDAYLKKNYQQIAVRWPKDFCEKLKSTADASGESLAGYIRKAIEARMLADGQSIGEESEERA